jgi:MFS family permease
VSAGARAQRLAVCGPGAAQCVFWGLLYYGFSVLIVPLQTALGASRPQLAGAFSLGLLVMALAAPLVGRRIDAGEAYRVMRTGLVLAVLGLLLLAASRALPWLYLAWAVIGAAMACLLYETALGLVLRAFAEPRQRLRALSTVTVLGGLASTVFLPLLALAVAQWGWRAAVLAAAVAVVLVGVAMERWVYAPLQVEDERARAGTGEAVILPGALAFHAYAIAGTLASVALTILLVPLLVDRGVVLPLAASVLAMLGLSQLPGRLYLMRGPALSPRAMAFAPLLLQGLGLAIVAVPGSLHATMLGVIVFGAGAGLHTLARPWLVERRVGPHHAGRVNARLARSQGLARAGGPLAATLLASRVDGGIALGAIGLVLVLLVPLLWSLVDAPRAAKH